MSDEQNPMLEEREAMEFDVVIVGAGPAGLSAAIKLKQLGLKNDMDISVVVVEKGSEVGAHILSGAVIDPIGIENLFTDWQKKGAPLKEIVREDKFYALYKKHSYLIPNFLMPPFMNNHGCYITSLGGLCKWLAQEAEKLGVEIYPGFACSEVIYDTNGAVKGIATGDMGVSKEGKAKDGFMRGMELHAKYTLFAEGARGSLSEEIIKKFSLRKDKNNPQKYGIGIKEIWQIDKNLHKPGFVQHTLGWPLNSKTGGGSFMYHYGDNLVSIGLVVHLNYQNPYLSPFHEFQRMKQHKIFAKYLKGGKRISYGARALTEGGFQSVPKLYFKGGAIIGCSAGFMNVPRIKGSHNAIISGTLAAIAIINALKFERQNDELEEYQTLYQNSGIYKELKKVRNVKPFISKFGTWLGMSFAGIDMWMNHFNLGLPFTLSHKKEDRACTEHAINHIKPKYEKPDGELSFDNLSSVYLSATNHEENQPVHLKLADENLPISDNLQKYAEPSQYYCPAGVYEVIENEQTGDMKFQINAQNCLHCKTCDIKDPANNIRWSTPEGTGGPNYTNMLYRL